MLRPKKENKKFSMKDSKSIKKQANEEEQKIVNVFKTPASGAIGGLKTDLFVENMAIDVKSALKSKQIIVTEEMLQTLIDQALSMHKDPVLLLNFPKSNLPYKKWVMRPIRG